MECTCTATKVFSFITTFNYSSVEMLQTRLSITITFTLFHSINLEKLYAKLCVNKGKNVGYCELGCFPSMIKLWQPIHVNMFASGKVVLTGIRQYNFRQCYVI